MLPQNTVSIEPGSNFKPRDVLFAGGGGRRKEITDPAEIKALYEKYLEKWKLIPSDDPQARIQRYKGLLRKLNTLENSHSDLYDEVVRSKGPEMAKQLFERWNIVRGWGKEPHAVKDRQADWYDYRLHERKRVGRDAHRAYRFFYDAWLDYSYEHNIEWSAPNDWEDR